MTQTVFGMNVTVFNNGSGTLSHYFAAAVPVSTTIQHVQRSLIYMSTQLTLVTIWAVIAFNPKKTYVGEPTPTWSKRLSWPLRTWQKLLFSRKTQSRVDHEA